MEWKWHNINSLTRGYMDVMATATAATANAASGLDDTCVSP